MAVSSASSNVDRFWDPARRSAFEDGTTPIAETPDTPLNITTVLGMLTSADSYER